MQALIVSVFIHVCVLRRVFFIVEQPGDSLLYEYPCVGAAIIKTEASFTSTYQKPFGAELEKHTILVSNIPVELMSTIVVERPTRTKNDRKFWVPDQCGRWVTGPIGSVQP